MSVCVCAFWSELFLATWHCSEEILISLRLEPMTVCKHLHAIKVLIAILTQTRWCQKRELRIRVKGLKACKSQTGTVQIHYNRIILDDKGGHVIGIEKLQWVDLIQHIMNMC